MAINKETAIPSENGFPVSEDNSFLIDIKSSKTISGRMTFLVKSITTPLQL